MRFRTLLVQTGKTVTGFRVPPEVVEGLGSGRRPPVRVTINGYTYRNTVAVMGGEYWIGVSSEHRGPAGVAGGTMIEVDLELDTAPREVVLPPELAAELDRDPAARRQFEALSYTNRKEIARSIADAKAPETRQRRLDKAMERLRGA